MLGRLAGAAAKAALLGEEVKVVHCDKIVISGKPELIVEEYRERRRRKGYPPKSQSHSRLPHLMVRRAIRGMLPWKAARGKEAYRRILCYQGLPEEFASFAGITLEKESVKKLPNLQFITIGDLCRQLRGGA